MPLHHHIREKIDKFYSLHREKLVKKETMSAIGKNI
jgi:hypothetical protein